jgi:flagellar motor switch protein FliN/FliY
MLGDQVVARGELVAVGDQFGVRITEVAPHDASR